MQVREVSRGRWDDEALAQRLTHELVQLARSRWLKFDEGLEERDDISVAVLLKGAHLRPRTAHEQGRQEL